MMLTSEKPYSILIADDDPRARESLARDRRAGRLRRPARVERRRSFGNHPGSPGRLGRLRYAYDPIDRGRDRATGAAIYSALPCILVTADATEDVMRQAFQVRAYSVIPKPVSRNVLLYTMLKALMKVYGTLSKEERTPKGPMNKIADHDLTPCFIEE